MSSSTHIAPVIFPVPTGDSSSSHPFDLPKQSPLKRSRTQLSCTHCRHAKLKCDRQDPCSQCTKKGRSSECIFPAPAPRRRPAVSMQNRLRHLESLVKDAMASQTPSSCEPSLDIDYQNSFGPSGNGSGQSNFQTSEQVLPEQSVAVEATTSSQIPPPTKTTWNVSGSGLGSFVRVGKENKYVGATHWAAMLDDIEEVNRYFDEEQANESTVPDSFSCPDTCLLFKSHPPATKQELLNMLPEREIVDQLVARYFCSNSPALHILHRPSFQKEYAKFCADPAGTPLSWLALLYAMMSLAVLAALATGEDVLDSRGTHMEVIQLYRLCCAQTLILSNYTQPGPYTIEGMLIYMEGEFIMSKFDQINCYLMGGVIIRLALRLGLHRDATKIGGNISVCQGEIRRRIWHTLVQIDSLSSFQIGLPSMAQSIESDTNYPSNLRDEDFGEDTTVLPESRPETERTPILYVLCKGRLIDVFGKVAAQAHRITPPSYSEVMHLDSLLEEAFARVPSFFRVVPLELAITDAVELIIMRFSIGLLYHKTRCVLHRRFLMQERENHQFAYSKKVGLESAMEVLHYQSDINRSLQNGGRLSRDKWFISTLSMHDFLLAATIVYLNVMQSVTCDGQHLSADTQNMITALTKSHSIWLGSVFEAPESKKASDVLGVMLKKIRLALGAGYEGMMASNGSSENDLVSTLSLSDSYPASITAPMSSDFSGWPAITATVNTTSDTTTPSSRFDSAPDSTSSNLPESFNTMLDLPSNFDWDLFDNHVRPQPAAGESWPDFTFDDLEY